MYKSVKISLLLFLLLLSSSIVIAQEKYSTYTNQINKKTYDISISTDEKNKENFNLYIDAMSFDKLHEKGGITISNKQLDDFSKSLNDAKLKYEEWVKTAKENNVKELDKTMAIKTAVNGYFLYGSKWQFHFNVFLKFDFKVMEVAGETKYLLILKTGELTSSSNQFMKVDGFAMVFTSSDEIVEFNSKISRDSIANFVNKPKKEDLFKD